VFGRTIALWFVNRVAVAKDDKVLIRLGAVDPVDNQNLHRPSI
jgi:hypothetical protein